MKEIVSIDLRALDLQSQCYEFSRRVKDETLIRSLFKSFKTQIKGHPKKEYLRCKLIRGHKRANRKIKKGKFLYNNQRDLSEKAATNWQKLSNCYFKYPAELDLVSKTLFEPIKHKSKAKTNSETSRSFNTDFCWRYFKEEAVRESFYYYVEFIFSDLDPIELSKFLGFACCQQENHSMECAYKWLLMKRYSNQIIIQDLKLDPWFPSTYGILPPLDSFLEL